MREWLDKLLGLWPETQAAQTGAHSLRQDDPCGVELQSHLLRCNISVVQRMPEENERAERFFGGWRAVASAWLVAIVFVGLFATAEALASRHSSSPREGSLAGVVIPRHEASVPGPDEVAASGWLERATAEAYSNW
jgi:hypothetical protein